MATEKQGPDDLTEGEPVGLDHIGDADAAERRPDAPQAVDLPVEPGDANAQPT